MFPVILPYEIKPARCCDKLFNMEDLSQKAIEAIDKILSRPDTLNSPCITLYNYCNTFSPEDPVLNDIYHYLIEENFATSNKPNSELDKYLVTFTSKGRKLHKSGSLGAYFYKPESYEKRILQYLQNKNGLLVTNRTIQIDLELDDKECEDTLQLLIARGYVNSEGPDGQFWRFGSEISRQGRIRLNEISNPISGIVVQTINDNRQIFTNTISGNFNALTAAGRNVIQINANSQLVIDHLNKLKGLNVDDTVIEKMIEMYLAVNN